MLGRVQMNSPPLREPVDPAERLAVGQGPDSLDPVEPVITRIGPAIALFGGEIGSRATRCPRLTAWSIWALEVEG